MNRILSNSGISKITIRIAFLFFIIASVIHMLNKNVDCSPKESNEKIYLDQDNHEVLEIMAPALYDSLAIADIADYDNDGIDDLLFSGSSDGSRQDLFIIVYGFPQFESYFNLEEARKTVIQLEERINYCAIKEIDSGDVNGDGKTDILFLFYGGARIILNEFNARESIYVNEGSAKYISVYTSYTNMNLYVKDLNGDNTEDICIMTNFALYVLFGCGTFPNAVNIDETELQILKILRYGQFYQSSLSPSTVSTDLNGDYFDDLIYCGGTMNRTIYTPDYGTYAIDIAVSGLELQFNGSSNIIDPVENNNNIFLIKRHTKYSADDDIEDRGAGKDLMNTLQAGDVDGDGYGDLFVSYYKTFIEIGEWGQMQAYSEIFLLYGHKDFTYSFDLDSTDKRYTKFVSPYMDDGMGSEINVCDLNGDGLDDFIFGDRNDQLLGVEVHKMYVVYGRTSYPDSVIVSEDFDYGIFIKGGDVGGTGDVNGDGYDDLAMNGADGCSYIMFGVGEKFSLSNELVRRLPPFYETSSLMSFTDGTQFRMQFKKGRPFENINFHLTNYGRQLPDSLANISQGASAISFYDLEFTGMLSAYTLECSFGYSDSLINANGVNQLDLTISCYDEGTGLWSKIPSLIDTLRNLVTFETDHLSLFALTDTSNHLISSIDDESSSQPLTCELSQNYPNPFNSSTTIKYQVPKSSLLNLRIYNILGQEVRTLINTRVKDGSHEVEWDGTNSLGQPVSSGIYIYRMTTSEGFADSKKMLLLR